MPCICRVVLVTPVIFSFGWGEVEVAFFTANASLIEEFFFADPTFV